MAKKQVMSEYQDWQDIDNGLRRMGEIDIQIRKLEGEQTLRTNEIKAEYDLKAEGLKAERKGIENNIALFTEAHKEEFMKTRSKELTFGLVAYRVTTKLIIRSVKATVAALKALGLESYLTINPEPDREAMKGLDSGTLAKVGASLKTEDKLRVEPNMERIKEKEAA